MFVYIDTASAVNSLADGGKGGRFTNSSLSASELLIYDVIVFVYGCNILSTHLPRPSS
jgi:hypothetical protein